jgi:hypothetical protein
METIDPAPSGAKLPSSQSLKCEGFDAVEDCLVALAAVQFLRDDEISPRHCERSEAIQNSSAGKVWIASLRSQ